MLHQQLELGHINNCPNNGTVWFYNKVTLPTDADRMANSVDPHKTALKRF